MAEVFSGEGIDLVSFYAELFFHNADNPNVLGKNFKAMVGKEHNAIGDFLAYAIDLHKLPAELVCGEGGDILEEIRAAESWRPYTFLSGIQDIFFAKAGADGGEVLVN